MFNAFLRIGEVAKSRNVAEKRNMFSKTGKDGRSYDKAEELEGLHQRVLNFYTSRSPFPVHIVATALWLLALSLYIARSRVLAHA